MRKNVRLWCPRLGIRSGQEHLPDGETRGRGGVARGDDFIRADVHPSRRRRRDLDWRTLTQISEVWGTSGPDTGNQAQAGLRRLLCARMAGVMPADRLGLASVRG